MLKSDVISHFGGTQQSVASALTLGGHRISQRAVSGWGEIVPLARALQIEQVTGGQLRADMAVYIGKKRPS